MTASLSLPDAEVDPIDVRNGLRQGCCMAPVLFNIFMWAVFQLWTRAVEEFDDVGAPLCYGSGGALLFKKGGDDLTTQRDCQFADDSCIVCIYTWWCLSRFNNIHGNCFFFWIEGQSR